ncbi:MAG: rubrerythrin family protein, partial [Lachnospiraceae bacterium]|nr:rubrerythrin family protein [Lachnospiraceae bacterium]
RIGRLEQDLDEHRLYVSDVQTGWICLNCGYIYTGVKAPAMCPVCQHDQGYFIRLELSPFAG